MATDNEATPVDLDINDAELFDAAIADTPETPAADETPIAAADEGAQARDEQGRFSAKEGTTDKPAEQPVQTDAAPKDDADDHGQIPSWRLREVAEARRAAEAKAEAESKRNATLEAQLQEMQRRIEGLAPKQPAPEQPKAERPDPLIDPEGYERYMDSKFEQRLMNERRDMSLSLAHRTYKKDFEDAYASAKDALAKGDAGLNALIQRSRDPGEALMEWHREQKVKQEVGNDPNAWLEKKLEERMNDPAFLAKAIERAKGSATSANTTTQRPNVQLPPSLAGMSRADSSRGGGNDDADLSDEGLFSYAIR